MKKTESSPMPVSASIISPAYARLQQQADAEADRQRSRAREDYLCALDRAYCQDCERQGLASPTPVSVRWEVLPTERAERLAHQPLAPRFAKWLKFYPEPTETTPTRLAVAVRNLHGAAQGGLNSSDPEPVDAAMQMIDDIPPDVGSPTARAISDYAQKIRPLPGRGRTVPGTLAHVEDLARHIEPLIVEPEARVAPTAIPIDLGAPDAAERPRRAVSKLSGGEAA